MADNQTAWWMPLFTIGLGLTYLLLGTILLVLVVLLTAGIYALGHWIPWVFVILIGLWGVGKLVRVPGDYEYERRQHNDFI